MDLYCVFLLQLIIAISLLTSNIESKLDDKYGTLANDTNCGKNWFHRTKYEDRMINGHLVHDGEFPSAVHLHITAKTELGTVSHFCAGTIIGEDLILTAAHCVENNEKYQLKVKVTRPKPIAKTDGSEPEFYSERICITPKFSLNKKPNNIIGATHDFAVVKLEHKFDFIKNATVYQPACLPMTQIPNDAELYLLGDGVSERSENFKLQWFPMVKKTCKLEEERQDPSILCALPNGRNGGACSGDSGGGLYLIKDKRLILYGITSYGLDETCFASRYAFDALVDVYNMMPEIKLLIQECAHKC